LDSIYQLLVLPFTSRSKMDDRPTLPGQRGWSGRFTPCKNFLIASRDLYFGVSYHSRIIRSYRGSLL